MRILSGAVLALLAVRTVCLYYRQTPYSLALITFGHTLEPGFLNFSMLWKLTLFSLFIFFYKENVWVRESCLRGGKISKLASSGEKSIWAGRGVWRVKWKSEMQPVLTIGQERAWGWREDQSNRLLLWQTEGRFLGSRRVLCSIFR